MRAILERSGKAQGTVYAYFKTGKRGIFALWCRLEFDRLTERTKAYLDQALAVEDELRRVFKQVGYIYHDYIMAEPFIRPLVPTLIFQTSHIIGVNLLQQLDQGKTEEERKEIRDQIAEWTLLTTRLQQAAARYIDQIRRIYDYGLANAMLPEHSLKGQWDREDISWHASLLFWLMQTLTVASLPGLLGVRPYFELYRDYIFDFWYEGNRILVEQERKGSEKGEGEKEIQVLGEILRELADMTISPSLFEQFLQLVRKSKLK